MNHARTLICILAVFAAFNLTFNNSTLAQQPPSVSGKILETMDSGGYTYLLVKTASGEQWVAIPETEATVGEEISYFEGMVMKNFTSKTLNRTFPSIIFSSGLAGNEHPAAASAQTEGSAADSFSAAVAAEKQAAQTSAAEPSQEMRMGTSGGSAGAVTPQQDIKVEKAAGENSFTVGEIFAQAKQLQGQKVRVRGQVMKVSPNIMGRHWIHLQDGTGDAMQNSHDLVFTSQELVEEGSIVTLEGVLAADKDFGAGYKYAAIVEKSVIIPE